MTGLDARPVHVALLLLRHEMVWKRELERELVTRVSFQPVNSPIEAITLLFFILFFYWVRRIPRNLPTCPTHVYPLGGSRRQ